MKKLTVLLFFSVLTFGSISHATQTVTTKYADGRLVSKTVTTTKDENKARHRHTSASLVPLCTEGNLICVLGDYTFTSNNWEKPIYANIGIMCTSDGGICTNGQYILRTNRTLYQ